MAEGYGGWGPDTVGSEHNDPRLSHEAFKPIQHKALSDDERADQVMNVVYSVQAASPSQRRAGARFYSRAHRDALHVGLGLYPGQQPYGDSVRGSERPGHERLSPKQVQEHVAHPEHFAEATSRGAGAIAAMSPSSPAGMDWEHNVPAAHAVWGLTTEHIANFRHADEALRAQLQALGAERTAKRTGGRDEIRAAGRQVRETKEAYRAASVAAREPLEGSPMKRAGGKAIIRAHEILTGEKRPEDVLPMKQKTGHFYRNINDPNDPGPATIDGRSHDIAIGKHLTWDEPRGLSAQGRYAHFVGVHQDAREILGMKTTNQVQATSWIQDKQSMMADASSAEKRLGKISSTRGGRSSR